MATDLSRLESQSIAPNSPVSGLLHGRRRQWIWGRFWPRQFCLPCVQKHSQKMTQTYVGMTMYDPSSQGRHEVLGDSDRSSSCSCQSVDHVNRNAPNFTLGAEWQIQHDGIQRIRWVLVFVQIFLAQSNLPLLSPHFFLAGSGGKTCCVHNKNM